MHRRANGERRAEYGRLEKGKGKNTMTIDQGDKSEAQGFFKFFFFSVKIFGVS